MSNVLCIWHLFVEYLQRAQMLHLIAEEMEARTVQMTWLQSPWIKGFKIYTHFPLYPDSTYLLFGAIF